MRTGVVCVLWSMYTHVFTHTAWHSEELGAQRAGQGRLVRGTAVDRSHVVTQSRAALECPENAIIQSINQILVP